jgi:hypothetical protein
MRELYEKREIAIFLTVMLAAAGVMWMEPDKLQQQAVAQSPMDMMEMMMSGGNMTDRTAMMLGGNNMSMPFNMGVVVAPVMCTTPNQLLGSLTGMFGGRGMNGNDGNATQQMMTEMMSQRMMSGAGMGMQNMSKSEVQQAMNFQVCFPAIGEEMMQHMQDMMRNAQNSTGGMMNGMMMQ